MTLVAFNKIIKMFKLILISVSLLIILSCEKDNIQYSLDGFEYPEGISIVNLKSESDCALPKCSDERLLRLKAKDVYGLISNDSLIVIPWQGDGYIFLELCNTIDPSEFKVDTSIVQKVLVSGDLIDACGLTDYGWPTIELYLFNLKNIKPYD